MRWSRARSSSSRARTNCSGSPQAKPIALAALRRMGQILFSPPNVKGWDGGAAWLNSQTLLTRENFASGLVNQASGGGLAATP